MKRGQIILKLAMAAFLGAAQVARAQSFTDANWSSVGAVPGVPGVARVVYAMAKDAAGNLYLGGGIRVAGSIRADGIARWDGTNWSTLGSGVSGSITSLAYANDNLYAGGSFTNAGGVAARNIARWDGTNWHALGSGLDSAARALVVSGGILYAGGSFTNAGGSPANGVARWDGSNWFPLGSGLGVTNTSIGVAALAVLDGNLYAGGYFTNAGSIFVQAIAKWDGANWTALGAGLSNSVGQDPLVLSLAVLGNELYAGGGFTTVGANSASDIARWDGTNWSPVGSGIVAVESLAVSGNDLYAGGILSNSASGVAKWDGTNWTSLGSGIGAGTTAQIWSLMPLAGDLYAGGFFSTAGGQAVSDIAKWDGSNWTAMGTGTEERVTALLSDGNRVIAGGYFKTIGGVLVNGIGRWDGSNWTSLGSGLSSDPQFPTPVWVSSVAGSESNLYVGGMFEFAGGVPAWNIAHWNGSNWSAVGGGLGSSVDVLAVSGSNVYAANNLSALVGFSENGVAKWDGSNWSALGSGLRNDLGGLAVIYALATEGSNLYAGGRFSSAGDNEANNVARWDGSNWFALGSGLTNSGSGQPVVYALAISGSNLYAGGQFTFAGGMPVASIARWDGLNWSAVGSNLNPLGTVYVLATSGNKLYAAGFSSIAAANSDFTIARWDGTNWITMGSAKQLAPPGNRGAGALTLLGNDLYVGGLFSIAGGKVSAYIARLYTQPLPALSVFNSGPNVTVKWPSPGYGDFILEQSDTLAVPMLWNFKSASSIDDGTNKSIIIPATNAASVFRLRRQ